MLCLETSGYKYSQRRCEDVVFWFVKKYLPRHKINIFVNHRGLIREGVYGWCCVMDCDWRPREFEIEMHNRLSPERYISILLHELWHVYQHVKGDLKDKGSKRYWRGIDHSDTDYSNQPWEVEAYEMEKKLFNEYMNIKEVNPFSNRLTAS
jgi:hypothetical protein